MAEEPKVVKHHARKYTVTTKSTTRGLGGDSMQAAAADVHAYVHVATCRGIEQLRRQCCQGTMQARQQG